LTALACRIQFHHRKPVKWSPVSGAREVPEGTASALADTGELRSPMGALRAPATAGVRSRQARVPAPRSATPVASGKCTNSKGEFRSPPAALAAPPTARHSSYCRRGHGLPKIRTDPRLAPGSTACTLGHRETNANRRRTAISKMAILRSALFIVPTMCRFSGRNARGANDAEGIPRAHVHLCRACARRRLSAGSGPLLFPGAGRSAGSAKPARQPCAPVG